MDLEVWVSRARHEGHDGGAEESHTADLTGLSEKIPLARSALGWQLGTWSSEMWLPFLIRMAHCAKLFAQTMWFIINTCSPDNPEFWCELGRGCLRDQPQLKPWVMIL